MGGNILSPEEQRAKEKRDAQARVRIQKQLGDELKRGKFADPNILQKLLNEGTKVKLTGTNVVKAKQYIAIWKKEQLAKKIAQEKTDKAAAAANRSVSFRVGD